MPTVFDAVRNRETLLEFHLDFELKKERSSFLPAAVGNAAGHAVDAAIYSWLAGLFDQVQPLLLKYREWFADSIEREEKFGEDRECSRRLLKSIPA